MMFQMYGSIRPYRTDCFAVGFIENSLPLHQRQFDHCYGCSYGHGGDHGRPAGAAIPFQVPHYYQQQPVRFFGYGEKHPGRGCLSFGGQISSPNHHHGRSRCGRRQQQTRPLPHGFE
jgi:hypothetical protein